jgi:hypothetical protein
MTHGITIIIRNIGRTIHEEDGHCSDDFLECESRKAYEDLAIKILNNLEKIGVAPEWETEHFQNLSSKGLLS